MWDLCYIIWNANPEIFSAGIAPRWYGLLFAGGFIVSQQILYWMFKKEFPEGEQKQAAKDVEKLTIYVVVATIIGARLGHVLFYEPGKYLSNPIDILKIWEGGLASHGAAAAILIALWLFARKNPRWTWLQVVDRIVIVVAITGCMIRLGNFFNSEIYGFPTQGESGVVFARHATDAMTQRNSPVKEVTYDKLAPDTHKDQPIQINVSFRPGTTDEQKKNYMEQNLPYMLGGRYAHISDHIYIDTERDLDYAITGRNARILAYGIPRHPTQLYESLTSLLIFFLLMYIWWIHKENTPHGRIFGLFLIVLFGLRFIHEFYKENQVEFEDAIPLNMGQWLSIPLVAMGIVIFIRSFRNQGTGS